MNADVEFAKLWSPGVPGIELFNAQLFHHAFSKHMHEAYTIGFNHAGQGCFTYRGEARCTRPGSFNLLNPGEVHTGQVTSAAGWLYRNIYISTLTIEQIIGQLEWPNQEMPWFPEPVVWDESLQISFYSLFQSLNESTAVLEQQSLMLGFLSQMFLKHALPRYQLQPIKPETKAITLIRAYLEAHYAENVSLNQLAQLVELSPYYLIRSFHQQVGLPPHGYQRHWQLKQAKRGAYLERQALLISCNE